VGLPMAGLWREVFNSDAASYGGSGAGNLGAAHAGPEPSHGLPASAEILMPPLATLFFRYEGG